MSDGAGQVRFDPTREVFTRKKPNVFNLLSIQARRVTCLLCFLTSHERCSCKGLIEMFQLFVSGSLSPLALPSNISNIHS